MNEFKIRKAGPEDVGLVLSFIRQLAEYEKMLEEVTADEQTLYHSMFVKRAANALILEEDGKAIGFALYFFNFSTFLGLPGLYVEDVFIQPDHRGKGYGKAVFCYLAKIAVEENCGRMEWTCLDWNEPSLRFYHHIGAIPMDQWTVQRLTGEALHKLAQSQLQSQS